MNISKIIGYARANRLIKTTLLYDNNKFDWSLANKYRVPILQVDVDVDSTQKDLQDAMNLTKILQTHQYYNELKDYHLLTDNVYLYNIFSRIRHSIAPMFIIGSGACYSYQDCQNLNKLIQQLNMPHCTTDRSIGYCNDRHSMNLGINTSIEALQALKQSDCIVSIGSNIIDYNNCGKYYVHSIIYHLDSLLFINQNVNKINDNVYNSSKIFENGLDYMKQYEHKVKHKNWIKYINNLKLTSKNEKSIPEYITTLLEWIELQKFTSIYIVSKTLEPSHINWHYNLQYLKIEDDLDEYDFSVGASTDNNSNVILFTVNQSYFTDHNLTTFKELKIKQENNLYIIQPSIIN